MAAEEIILDACDLEPPEPYEQATEVLKNLRAGQYVRMIIPRQPRLLYPWLAEHGFNEITRQLGDDLFEIVIWAGSDSETGIEISRKFN